MNRTRSGRIIVINVKANQRTTVTILVTQQAWQQARHVVPILPRVNIQQVRRRKHEVVGERG